MKGKEERVHKGGRKGRVGGEEQRRKEGGMRGWERKEECEGRREKEEIVDDK